MKVANDVQIIGLNDGFTFSKRAGIASKDFQSLKEEQIKEGDYLSVLNNSEGIRVVFQDEESSKFVSLNLTQNNFARILKHFHQKDNYFLREDGAIRLNGEAQNFVSGWFKNAAYDLNYLKADADKNGLIQGKENEELYLYNSIVIYTPDIHKGGPNDTVRQIYLQGFGNKFLANDDKERNLDGALNALLAFDKNADEKISILELEGSREKVIAKARVMFDNPSTISREILEKLKRKLEEIEEASEDAKEDGDVSAIKDRALEQGLSALNMKELLLLKEKYPDEYEQLKQKDLKNLGQDLSASLQKQMEQQSLKIIDKLV